MCNKVTGYSFVSYNIHNGFYEKILNIKCILLYEREREAGGLNWKMSMHIFFIIYHWMKKIPNGGCLSNSLQNSAVHFILLLYFYFLKTIKINLLLSKQLFGTVSVENRVYCMKTFLNIATLAAFVQNMKKMFRIFWNT